MGILGMISASVNLVQTILGVMGLLISSYIFLTGLFGVIKKEK